MEVSILFPGTKLPLSANTYETPSYNLSIDSEEVFNGFVELFKAVVAGEDVQLVRTLNGVSESVLAGSFSLTIVKVHTVANLRSSKELLFDHSIFKNAAFEQDYSESYRQMVFSSIKGIGWGSPLSSIYLCFWKGKLITITNFIPSIHGSGRGEDIGPYAMFGLHQLDLSTIDDPSEILTAKDKLSTSYSSVWRWHHHGNSRNLRLTFAKNLVQVNAFSLTNDTYSLNVCTTTAITGTLPSNPKKVKKIQAFDAPMRALIEGKSAYSLTIYDIELDRPGMFKTWADWKRFQSGLVANVDMLPLDSLFTEIPRSTVLELRELLSLPDQYVNKLPAAVSFDDTEKRKGLALRKTSDDMFAVVIKTSAKAESELSAKKTRVASSVLQHLLSIAYSVILHRDLILPEGCYLHCFSFNQSSYAKLGSRRRWCDQSLLKNYRDYDGPLTIPEDTRLETAVSTFCDCVAAGKITTTMVGTSLSVLSSNVITPSRTEEGNKFQEFLGWLVAMDMSKSVWSNHYPGLLRACHSGMDLKAFTVNCGSILDMVVVRDGASVLHPIFGSRKNKLRNAVTDEDKAYNQQVDDYAESLLRAKAETYYNNFVPRDECEEAFRINDTPSLHYRVEELFRISPEGMSILLAGHRCISMSDVLAWWSAVESTLHEIVDSDSTYEGSQQIYVSTMLTYFTKIVDLLLARIEDL